MACSKSAGFSLAELLVSIGILTLLATFTVMSLSTSQKKEEVLTAARIVAGDLRALQTRALNAENVKTCKNLGINVTCENGLAPCTDPMSCAPAPPYAFGAFFRANSSTYPFFAEVDASNKDFQDTPGAGEDFYQRRFSTVAVPNVKITGLVADGVTTTQVSVTFGRQNGSPNIMPCIGACSSASTLHITLTQMQSGDVANVYMNAITGRISID